MAADPAYLFIRTRRHITEAVIIKTLEPLTQAGSLEAIMLMGSRKPAKGHPESIWRVRPAGPVQTAMKDTAKIAATLNLDGKMPSGWLYVQPWSSHIATASIHYEWADHPRDVIAQHIKNALKIKFPGIDIISATPERESGPSNGRFIVHARFPNGRPVGPPTTLRINDWGVTFSWSGLTPNSKPGSKEWNHWGVVSALHKEAQSRSAKRKERKEARDKNGSPPPVAKPSAKPRAPASTKPSSPAPHEAAPPAAVSNATQAAAASSEAARLAKTVVDRAQRELALRGYTDPKDPASATLSLASKATDAASCAHVFINTAASEVSRAADALNVVAADDEADKPASLECAKAASAAASAAADSASAAAARATADAAKAAQALSEAKDIATAKSDSAPDDATREAAKAEAEAIDNSVPAVDAAVKAATTVRQASDTILRSAQACAAAVASTTLPARAPVTESMEPGDNAASAQPSTAPAAAAADASHAPRSPRAPVSTAATMQAASPPSLADKPPAPPLDTTDLPTAYVKRGHEAAEEEEKDVDEALEDPQPRSGKQPSSRSRKAFRKDGVLGIDNRIINASSLAAKPSPAAKAAATVISQSMLNETWLTKKGKKTVPAPDTDSSPRPTARPRASSTSSAVAAPGAPSDQPLAQGPGSL
jgi:hypothetical protein